MASFACFTADLVGSRATEDRASTQRRLKAAIAAVNRKAGGALAVPASITVGDEWQALARDLAAAVEIDLHFRRLLLPDRFVSGISVGEITTALARRTGEMDGPCFHLAREAVAAAAGRGWPATVLRSGDEPFDAMVEGYMNLLHAVSATWTAKQLKALQAYEATGTETAAAKRLRVSQPTVHNSLAGAAAKTYLASERALTAYVRAHMNRADA
jgi:hypothetical protein